MEKAVDHGMRPLSTETYNLNQFLIEAKRTFPKKDAMLYLKGGEYSGINWEETFEVAQLFCLGLMSLGVEKGDKVGIFAHTRYEWRLCDYGVLFAAACTVTLYPSLTPAQVGYIVNDSSVKIMFVGHKGLLGRVLAVKDQCPTLKYIIVMSPMGESDYSDMVLSLDSLIERGEKFYKDSVKYKTDKTSKKILKRLLETQNKLEYKIARSFDQEKIKEYLERLSVNDINIALETDDPFIKRYHSLKPDDLASIVYTSGTTGVPKGAMLSHKNFYSNVLNTLIAVPITSKDKSLAFLPLSHVLGRLTDHFLMTRLGATVAFARNTDTIVENLAQVRPTYMTAVPRIFEKVWDKLTATIEEEGKEELFEKMVDWATEYQTSKRQGLEPSFGVKAKNKLAHTFIFKKIKEKLGGRIRFMFSGGAALSVQIARFFQAADIKILEGYGLTETSPVLTVNTLGRERIGTVGTPIPDTDVKIAEDGEIIAKGPQVFHGYINKPEETASCFNEEGYFMTGDLGSIDEQGFLKITGRKKTLIVLRTGKKVSPVMVEEAIKASRFIEQACLLGDDQKFTTGIVIPNFEFLGEWARENNIANFKDDDLIVDNSTTKEEYVKILENRKVLLEKESVLGFINGVVSDSQKELSEFEKMKSFIIMPDDWNEYNELLTPSLKMKRPNIVKYYLPKIKAMYGEHWME